MRIAVWILFVSILFASCDSEPEVEKKEPETVQHDNWGENAATGVCKQYRGTIAGQPVVLNYSQYASTQRGEYYYENIGQTLSLMGWGESNLKNYALRFTEYPSTERTEQSATWYVNISADSMTGIWVSADSARTYPVLLKEVNDPEMVHFSIVVLEDSARLIDSLSEPKATMSYSLLIPDDNDEQSEYLMSVIKKGFDCAPKEATIYNCIEQTKADYFANYRSMIKDEDPKMLTASFNNWATVVDYTIMYNEKGFVVLNNHNYEYSGGAHGNYGSNFKNIDVRNKKVLALSDIMAIDTVQLTEDLKARVRKLYKVGDKTPLSAFLFSDDLHIPENYYISNKGITFVYGIYEIASYAEGEISLFIPYSKMMTMLKPDFKKRMGLIATT